MSRTSPMISFSSFFFNDTAPTEIYTLSLHDALPISVSAPARALQPGLRAPDVARPSASVLLDRVGRPLLRLGHLVPRPPARAPTPPAPAARHGPRHRSGVLEHARSPRSALPRQDRVRAHAEVQG